MSTSYKTAPLSDAMENHIKDRLNWLKLHLQEQRTAAKEGAIRGTIARLQELGRTEGNIGALEWVLREADSIKNS